MQAFPSSGRVVLLVVLLLVVCYVADWTDDYHSYAVFTQYSAFQSANGYKPLISGGRSNLSSMLASFAMGAGNGPRQTSALETVFGGPLGSMSAASDDASSSRLARSLNSADPLSRSADNLDGSSLSNRLGFSGNNSGLGPSTSGSSLALFGTNSGSGAARSSIFSQE